MPGTGAGILKARLMAVLVAALLPLAAYLAVGAEATRHAALDWLEMELQDAAQQAAAGEAMELVRAGRAMQASDGLQGMGPDGWCAALRPLLEAATVPARMVRVHRADASLACSSPSRPDGPGLPAAHVRAALAADGKIALAGEPGGSLLLSRAMVMQDGAAAVLTVALDPGHLPPLGLPLRREQAGRLVVDPDDGMVLVAQQGHALQGGQALAMPRVLAALRSGQGGVALARDAGGVSRLVGHAPLPLAGAGVAFAGRAALLIDLPYDPLLAEADLRRRDQWLAAGALAALGVLLAWLLAWRWLVRPVRAMLSPGANGQPIAADASYEARALVALRPAGSWLRQQGDLAAVADAAGEMFLRLDADLRVTYASSATRAVIGYSPGEVVDAALANEPGWEPCLAQIAALRGGEMSPPPCRLIARRRDDGEVMLEVRTRRLGDGGFLLACRDVGAEAALERELEEARERLAALALSDPQTGLPNRRRFDEALGQELGRAKRAQEPISLVLLQLEDWPVCAAKLGAEQAEVALRQIGRLMTGALRRPGDFAARLEEGLFGVLLPTTDRIGAQRVADRLREAVAEAWRQLSYAGLAARIGAGSILPLGEGDSPDGLVELAVQALQEESAAHGAALLTPRPVPHMVLRPAEAAPQEAQAS